MSVNFDGLRSGILNNYNRIVASINARLDSDGSLQMARYEVQRLAKQVDDLRTDLVFLKNLMSESEGYTYLEKPDLMEIDIDFER